jgi:4-hydroxybenzoate polyprenyltransferase
MTSSVPRSAPAAALSSRVIYMMGGVLKLLRPKQWVKNTFVFAAVVFSGQFLVGESVIRTLGAFVLFCIGSSATYVLNDIRDRESDRLHPTKAVSRPIASGRVPVPVAIVTLVLLYILLGLGALGEPFVVAVIAGYLVLNVGYTFWLKHIAVVDIFVIAVGFVLRVVAGAVAIQAPVSAWTFITTLCLALYLAAIKRRQELGQRGASSRKVLVKYSLPLVERYAEMAATGALVFYSMFVLSEQPRLVLSIPLVLFGLFRYWYVVDVHERGESPTDALFSDLLLLLCIVTWVGVCAWALWPGL